MTFPTFLALLMMGIVLWLAYLLWPDRAYFKNGAIVCRQKWRRQQIALSDLEGVTFHYHAVVGFIGVWEFTSRSGLTISAGTHRISRRFLAQLEKHLPPFRAADFDAAFKDGDVEDSLLLWQSGHLTQRPSVSEDN